MKQELISTGLALADFVHRHPKRITAVIAALLLGTALRRLTGENMFVYILGRGFLGTALCVFAASVLAQWASSPLPGVGGPLSLVAHWLMAWGDASVTGMLCAVFVAFKPEWLATWSDRLYLRQPGAPGQ